MSLPSSRQFFLIFLSRFQSQSNTRFFFSLSLSFHAFIHVSVRSTSANDRHTKALFCLFCPSFLSFLLSISLSLLTSHDDNINDEKRFSEGQTQRSCDRQGRYKLEEIEIDIIKLRKETEGQGINKQSDSSKGTKEF